MSEERRQHEEMLKEVDDLFAKHGLTESIEAFLASKEVTEEIEKATRKFIDNMRKMEADAPTEKVKETASKLRAEIEASKETMAEEIIASFKVGFAGSIDLVIMVTEGLEEQEDLLAMIKEAIPVKGLEDIKGISSHMLYHNSKMFMREIYKNYVPAEMPAEVLNFVQMLFGHPLLPIKAIFPEWYANDDPTSKN